MDNKTICYQRVILRGRSREPVAHGVGETEKIDKLQITQQLLRPIWIVVLLHVLDSSHAGKIVGFPILNSLGYCCFSL